MYTLLTLADLTSRKGDPSLEGIFLVDKPLNWTSHDVIDRVRRLSGIKRVGHAGTLDPLATGLLVVLIGRNYTKRQAEFMHQDKEYEVTAQLGATSPSYDLGTPLEITAEWSVIEKVTREKLEAELSHFRGEISQTAPVYSALKKSGRKLYELARAGETENIELPVRTVHISKLELQEFEIDQSNQNNQKAFFFLSIKCSSGTYVRSIVHDLGQALGVGAVVTQLRRTRSGEFHVESAEKLAT